MCRSQLSIGYDGKVFDCDFHQMENVFINSNSETPLTVFELESAEQVKSIIPWRPHCYGCTEMELVVADQSLKMSTQS